MRSLTSSFDLVVVDLPPASEGPLGPSLCKGLDGVVVGSKCQFAPGECRDQHEQRRLRQVKIRQERVNHPELESRMDEKVRKTRPGFQGA